MALAKVRLDAESFRLALREVVQMDFVHAVGKRIAEQTIALVLIPAPINLIRLADVERMASAADIAMHRDVVRCFGINECFRPWLDVMDVVHA